MIIWSLSREKMGEAKLLYVDRRKHKKEEHLKTYVRKVTQQIEDLAVSLRDQADQSEIDGTQHSEIFGTFLFLLLLFCFFFNFCSLRILVNCWL